MRNDGWIGKKGLRYWYYRYRDSQYYAMVVIGLSVTVCLLLLFNVIIPQINQWFSIRQQVVETRERIAILEDNINFVNNLDRGRLETQLQNASTALPPEKDFGSMLNVLSNAALNSGVALNDYSFQVGNIASSSGVQTNIKTPGLDSVRITVVVNGQLEGILRFIRTMQTSVPLSEVVSIDGSGQNMSISVQFYQKPYPDITIPETDRLTPIADEKVLLLQELSGWDRPTRILESTSSSGSGAVVPLF